MKRRSHAAGSQGFTLLELLVATVIMGIAVVGLLSAISTSMRNASRLGEYDKATLAARRTMEELLLDRKLPKDQIVDGRYSHAGTGIEGGWRARLTDFEAPPEAPPGVLTVERIELEVWWTSGDRQRRLVMEGFRRAMMPLPAAEAP